MNRSNPLLNQRRKYVKEEVSRAQKAGIPTTKAVAALSQRLFISERMLYKDLKAA